MLSQFLSRQLALCNGVERNARAQMRACPEPFSSDAWRRRSHRYVANAHFQTKITGKSDEDICHQNSIRRLQIVGARDRGIAACYVAIVDAGTGR